jgi:hypothetical protein
MLTLTPALTLTPTPCTHFHPHPSRSPSPLVLTLTLMEGRLQEAHVAGHLQGVQLTYHHLLTSHILTLAPSRSPHPRA